MCCVAFFVLHFSGGPRALLHGHWPSTGLGLSAEMRGATPTSEERYDFEEPYCQVSQPEKGQKSNESSSSISEHSRFLCKHTKSDAWFAPLDQIELEQVSNETKANGAYMIREMYASKYYASGA